jgi:AcrR family transcriptional regulator
MPRSRQSTKKELVTAFRTREILTAARSLLERGGMEGLTMEGIAGAAGLAKGTLYLYFPSKKKLIQELLSQVGENIVAALESLINAPQPPEEKLRQAVTWLLANLERERFLFPVFMHELWRERAETPGRERRFQDLDERINTRLTHLFAEGIAQGQFNAANPRLLSFLLRGLVRAVGHYQMAAGTEEAIKEATPILLALLFSGLTPKSPSAAEVTPS